MKTPDLYIILYVLLFVSLCLMSLKLLIFVKITNKNIAHIQIKGTYTWPLIRLVEFRPKTVRFEQIWNHQARKTNQIWNQIRASNRVKLNYWLIKHLPASGNISSRRGKVTLSLCHILFLKAWTFLKYYAYINVAMVKNTLKDIP